MKETFMNNQCEHCKKLSQEVSWWRRKFLGKRSPLNKQGQIIEATFMAIPTETMMKDGPVKSYIEIVKMTLREG